MNVRRSRSHFWTFACADRSTLQAMIPLPLILTPTPQTVETTPIGVRKMLPSPFPLGDQVAGAGWGATAPSWGPIPAFTKNTHCYLKTSFLFYTVFCFLGFFLQKAAPRNNNKTKTKIIHVLIYFYLGLLLLDWLFPGHPQILSLPPLSPPY